jgi:periplasmic protein TonB
VDAFDDEYGDRPSGGRVWVRRVALAIALLMAAGAVFWFAKDFLKPGDTAKPGVQQVAILRQPPPPPPKPPEKPPEPPKLKEEVKIDQPKPEPTPEAPKPAEAPPAPDQPLGLDADGAAGNDGFGLAANRGGRDLIGSRAGAGGSGGGYYAGLLQRHFFEALSRNRKVLGQEFRVTVRVWIGDDGRVQRTEVVKGSGEADVDELIRTTLAGISPLREVPPSQFRQLQFLLSNRS